MTSDPGKPSRHEREMQRRRHDILDAATRLFMAHGYAGTTMQMIADQAEYSVGYLYQHFTGKKDLLDEIIDLQLAAFETSRREIETGGAGHPLEILRRRLEHASRMLTRQSNLVPLFLDYQKTSPEKIRPRLDQYRREDARLFRDAVRAGEIRDCDPELTAAACDGLFDGLLKFLAETDQLDRLNRIPGIVEDLLLKPLALTPDTDERKDPAKS